MQALQSTVIEIVEGDLRNLNVIIDVDHSELEISASYLPHLTVSRFALLRVLKEWQDGGYTADQVQKWASFVRRGYVQKISNGTIRPVSIAYDMADEDLIVEIIGRLDQIGDMIDGDIDQEEQKNMLSSLGVIPGEI